MNDTAILRLKKNDDLYRDLGNDKYLNLRTKVEWDIPPEKMNEIFVIDYNATMMINKYPHLEEFIFALKLKLEK